jgi:hypothetical protein
MRGRGCLSARGNRGDNREEERAYQHQEMAEIDDRDSGGGGGGRFRGIGDFHRLGKIPHTVLDFRRRSSLVLASHRR